MKLHRHQVKAGCRNLLGLLRAGARLHGFLVGRSVIWAALLPEEMHGSSMKPRRLVYRAVYVKCRKEGWIQWDEAGWFTITPAGEKAWQQMQAMVPKKPKQEVK
jgi:hypothetical protein